MWNILSAQPRSFQNDALLLNGSLMEVLLSFITLTKSDTCSVILIWKFTTFIEVLWTSRQPLEA